MFEIFTVVCFQTIFFCNVALYSIVVISDINSCKCCVFFVEMESNMSFRNVGKFVPDFMEAIPLCLLLIKQTKFVQSNTMQVYLINQTALACMLHFFGLYLGHPQACKHKNVYRKIQCFCVYMPEEGLSTGRNK